MENGREFEEEEQKIEESLRRKSGKWKRGGGGKVEIGRDHYSI